MSSHIYFETNLDQNVCEEKTFNS